MSIALLTAPFRPLIKPGKIAPNIVLLNQWGTLTDVAVLCREKPVLLTFVVGGNHGPSVDFLRHWQHTSDEWNQLNNGKGVHRVAITADDWHKVYSLTEHEGLTYPVLHDPFAKTAFKYGTVWWKGFLTRSSWVLIINKTNSQSSQHVSIEDTLNVSPEGTQEVLILEAKRGRPSIDQIADLEPLILRGANKY